MIIGKPNPKEDNTIVNNKNKLAFTKVLIINLKTQTFKMSSCMIVKAFCIGISRIKLSTNSNKVN